MKTALAIRHLAFEGLGSLEDVLRANGYAVDYHDLGRPDFARFDPVGPDLLVVLGGPIGVYETASYPFLTEEVALLRARLAADRPTLGICLGAQLMAKALGAEVYPGTAKEIGYASVSLSEAGQGGVLAGLHDVPVLHWHGDTFDLPEGACRLASTAITANQAFDRGPHLLGLQFHVEAGGTEFEQWLVGHTSELAECGIDVGKLRAENARLGPALRVKAAAMFSAWLAGFDSH